MAFSCCGLHLPQRVAARDEAEEVEELHVRFEDLAPAGLPKEVVSHRSLKLLGPHQSGAESVDLGVAEGAEPFGPGAVRLLVARVLLESALVLQVPQVLAGALVAALPDKSSSFFDIFLKGVHASCLRVPRGVRRKL